MYSRIAGTGSRSALSGSQMRAASRVRSLSGIQTFSSSRTAQGSSFTIRIASLQAGSVRAAALRHAPVRPRGSGTRLVAASVEGRLRLERHVVVERVDGPRAYRVTEALQ